VEENMKEAFKKLMMKQVQDALNNFSKLAKKPTPPKVGYEPFAKRFACRDLH